MNMVNLFSIPVKLGALHFQRILHSLNLTRLLEIIYLLFELLISKYFDLQIAK